MLLCTELRWALALAMATVVFLYSFLSRSSLSEVLVVLGVFSVSIGVSVLGWFGVSSSSIGSCSSSSDCRRKSSSSSATDPWRRWSSLGNDEGMVFIVVAGGLGLANSDCCKVVLSGGFPPGSERPPRPLACAHRVLRWWGGLCCPIRCGR